MTILRALGFVWMVVAGTAIAIVGLVGSYFLFIGGLFDVLTDKMLTSGIAVIDDANRDAVATHGGTTVGLIKIFILEPLLMMVGSIALGISNLIGMALFGIGSLPDYLRERRREA